MTVLIHHGIDGQKWGVQNGPPYPLDEKTHRKVVKKDMKWIAKHEKKIKDKAYKKSEKEIKKAASSLEKQYARNSDGNVSKAYINALNQEMARIMTNKVSDLSAPSGRVVTFVAKRGELGVYTALADEGYDMSQVKNGVWDSGRIAYKKSSVKTVRR